MPMPMTSKIGPISRARDFEVFILPSLPFPVVVARQRPKQACSRPGSAPGLGAKARGQRRPVSMPHHQD
jgi:hypothetical protein